MHKSTIDPHSISDIVWLNTAFLGDLVLGLAPMRLVQARHPHIKHHLITTSVGAQALADQGYESIVVFEKRKESTFAAMRAVKRKLRLHGKSPVLLQAHRSNRSSLLAKYLGMETVAFYEAGWSFLAKHRVERPIALHEVNRVANLLQPLGYVREDFLGLRPQMLVRNEQPSWLASLEGSEALIGVVPGSVWGTKRWPLEYFEQLTSSLLKSKPTARIVLVGSDVEASYAANLASKFAHDGRVINLMGKTALRDLPALYAKLNLVVSNDSSSIHYASGLNVPTVAIFGATTPSLGFGPLANKHRICEFKNLVCRPCSDHGPMECPLSHFKCMRELSVEAVHVACLDLLRS